MYFLYPKEYFFPVIVKDSDELNLKGQILEDFMLSRGFNEELESNKIFNNLDDEFAEEISRKIRNY